MPSNDLNISPSYFRTLKEPSLYAMAQRKPEVEQYRLTVLSGITPIHSLRIKTNTDGSGTIITKVAHQGTRMRGTNTLKNQMSRKVSTLELEQLRSSFKKIDFQNIYPDQIENEDELWLHPTLLCYESVHDGRHHIVCDSTGNITEITRTLIPQFYRLGGIDKNADWSLFEYFRLDEID